MMTRLNTSDEAVEATCIHDVAIAGIPQDDGDRWPAYTDPSGAATDECDPQSDENR
jgi:hypothetical protein